MFKNDHHRGEKLENVCGRLNVATIRTDYRRPHAYRAPATAPIRKN
jgi:hypothetical protein